MADIEHSDGRKVVDYMARDYDSLLRSMRELIPYYLPEWTEHESEADFGNVLLQLFAHMGDQLSYYQDRVANESFLGTAQTRRSIIHHLRLIGYRLATAAPAAATLEVALPVDCDETITIKRGDAFATKSQKDRPSVRFEYTAEEPLEVDCRTLPVRSEDEKKVFRFPIEEGRLVKREVLGTSDGTPNQQYAMAHRGLILRSLGQGQAVNRDVTLISRLGSTITPWTLQETLAFSRAGQRDFVIEIGENDQTTVRFGDGAFGAIPTAEATLEVTYRVGGGQQGNVSAGRIQAIADAPQLSLLGAEVTNPNPATGGAERESIEHAVQHAPAVFRSLKRAVTADDYEALALEFSGVGKVRAEAANGIVVRLFVAPEGGGQVSDVLRANLLAYFEDKRPLTTRIEVEDVDYVPVQVTAEIGVESYYDPGRTKELVQQAAGRLLAFDNVDFGQTIYLSKFYEAMEAVEGVTFVNITEFRRGDHTDSFEHMGKLTMGVNEVPAKPDEDLGYTGGVRVTLPEEEGL